MANLLQTSEQQRTANVCTVLIRNKNSIQHFKIQTMLQVTRIWTLWCTVSVPV